MSTLFPQPFTFFRQDGAYVDGIWTLSNPAQMTFMGSVQSLSALDIDQTPALSHEIGVVKVFASTKMNVRGMDGAGGLTQGDMVLHQDFWWEIVKGGEHNNGLIPHFKYFAERRVEFAPPGTP